MYYKVQISICRSSRMYTFKNRTSFFFVLFSGQGIYTFVHKPDLVHSCKRDILLCRRKAGCPSEWTRVRQLPTWTSFNGPFVLCTGKDLRIKWTIDTRISSGELFVGIQCPMLVIVVKLICIVHVSCHIVCFVLCVPRDG